LDYVLSVGGVDGHFVEPGDGVAGVDGVRVFPFVTTPPVMAICPTSPSISTVITLSPSSSDLTADADTPDLGTGLDAQRDGLE
jgi:hypothetical protein